MTRDGLKAETKFVPRSPRRYSKKNQSYTKQPREKRKTQRDEAHLVNPLQDREKGKSRCESMKGRKRPERTRWNQK